MARFAAVGDDHSNNVDAFESGAAEFLEFCSEMDLTQPSSVVVRWGRTGVPAGGSVAHAQGTELTVHLTDAAVVC
jgi:hypothetical protein